MAENENPDLSSAEEKETTALPDLEGARFPRRRGGSLVRKVFYMIVLVAVVLAGIEGVSLLREHFRNFKSTDNAYVRATVVPVSPLEQFHACGHESSFRFHGSILIGSPFRLRS